MEDEAEKMAALKRAYADIILNTAKESAARILASERKALRFQQSLFAAKEEALATLLRLKSIMDSKIKEAEKTSMIQVTRIQELENQLSEAEDTVVYLREELKRVNNEMQKMKNDIADSLSEKSTNGPAIPQNGVCRESKLSSESKLCSLAGSGNISTLDIVNVTSSQKSRDSQFYSPENATQNESLKDPSGEKECASNRDLASIIMRSKEPELYRNGCTQRIRALEHNLLNVKVPLGQSDHQLSDMKNGSKVFENGKLEHTDTTADSAELVKVVTQDIESPTESKGIVPEESSSGNGHAIKFFRRLSPRKNGSRFNPVESTDRVTPDLDKISHESSSAEGSKISGQEDSIPEEPPRIILNPCSSLLTAVSRKSTDKGLDSEIENNTRNDVEHDNSIGDPILSNTTEKDGIFPEEEVQDDAGMLLHAEDAKLKGADQNATDNLDGSDIKDDVPGTHSDTKDETTYKSRETPGHAGTDKFLKYTFRRKRTRASSSGQNESILPEKIPAKKKAVEKPNALPEQQKPSITELPRNNRRLVQVARQLISLSEKRW